MTDLALSDAPEPIETPAEEVTVDAVASETEGVEAEQKGVEPSDSSTETAEKNPAQKRIDELTRIRRDTERDRDYWRDQAISNKPEPPKEVVKEPIKTLANFDFDESAYAEYIADRVEAGAVDKAMQKLEENQDRENAGRRQSSFKGKEADFSKEIDDYQDVARNPSLSISEPMRDVITDMDDGPAVLYYLGKNPDIADNIAYLPPMSAARELGRIEAKLAAKNGETVSKAPEPAPKLKAGNPAIEKSPDEMNQSEWNAHRRKVIANRRR